MTLDLEEIGNLYGEASEDLWDNENNKYTNIIRSQAFKDLGGSITQAERTESAKVLRYE